MSFFNISTNKNKYPKKILCSDCNKFYLVKKWFIGENKKVFSYCDCGKNNKIDGVFKE